MRTIIIGDVHGCLDELLSLVRLARRDPDDRVVLVGDLVAKGPDSPGVVAWARESRRRRGPREPRRARVAGAGWGRGRSRTSPRRRGRAGERRRRVAARAPAVAAAGRLRRRATRRGARRLRPWRSAGPATAGHRPQPAQHHRQGQTVEEAGRHAVGRGVVWPRTRGLRTRRRSRAATAALCDGAGHGLRLRQTADRSGVARGPAGLRSAARAYAAMA